MLEKYLEVIENLGGKLKSSKGILLRWDLRKTFISRIHPRMMPLFIGRGGVLLWFPTKT